jgi:hypothetical protein
VSGRVPAPTTFYRPAEVAKLLHCSEWWIKEQARKRRIPFCWIGGSYLFTDDHVAEIVRIFEVRPAEDHVAAVPSTIRSSTVDGSDDGVVRLQARLPRRLREGTGPSSTAA